MLVKLKTTGFLGILVVLSCATYKAQGGFKKKHFLAGSTTSACRDVIEAPNGNFIMVGITVKSGSSNRLTIAGTDAQGNLLWRKDYGTDNFQYLDNDLHMRGPIVKDGGGFYHTLCVKDTNGKYIGVLIKFNFNGDLVWQKKYTDPDPLEDVIPQGLTKSVDGGFLITGFFQNWSASPYRKCIVIKTDKDGNELWRKKIGKVTPDVQDGKSIVQDSVTKRILIVGYQYIGINSETYSNVLILDSLGSKILQTTFNGAGGGVFSEIIQLRDKNFIACGYANANNKLGNLKRNYNQAVKFDINGVAIWNKNYDTLSPFCLMSFAHERKNGDLMLGGYLDTFYNHNLSGPVRMRLYRTDATGNIKWKKFIGGATTEASSEFMRSMNPTNDGGYIMAGFNVYMPNPRPYNIVKVDSTGCDDTEAYCKSLEADIKSNRLAGISLEMYPNPSSAIVNFKIDSPGEKSTRVEINDIIGKQVMAFQILPGKQFSLNTAEIGSGIYFVNIYCEDQLVETRKLVIDHSD